MEKNSVILLTGAAGFIGSYLLSYLNNKGFEKVVICDDFTVARKEENYSGKKYIAKVERDNLFDWLQQDKQQVDFVFHLGARTDTTEFDYKVHERLNLKFSKKVWTYCTTGSIPLIYASSAATYGKGEEGYIDDHAIVEKLRPLNPYGISKNEFDKWALAQQPHNTPPFWAGLKFFNVYGPNESHKGRMASVVFHAYNQVKANGIVRLFRSHKENFKDGEQLRDFIFVDDVAAVCFWMMQHTVESGIYNLGTGKARSFIDLVTAIYTSMNLTPEIEFIDIPPDIRESYQYFTEAEMNKLRSAGYTSPFHSLEQGVGTYVKEFLVPGRLY